MGKIEEIQNRMQQLWNIPDKEYSFDNSAEMNALIDQTHALGYQIGGDDNNDEIRLVKKPSAYVALAPYVWCGVDDASSDQ